MSIHTILGPSFLYGPSMPKKLGLLAGHATKGLQRFEPNFGPSTKKTWSTRRPRHQRATAIIDQVLAFTPPKLYFL